MNIELTQAAQAYLHKMLEKQQGKALRLSIKKTGCSGFSYVPEIVKEIQTTDINLTINNLTISIDVKWQHLLEDIQIDYQEEEKTGLKQKRLIINNPKEAAKCGCGESFHIDETQQ